MREVDWIMRKSRRAVLTIGRSTDLLLEILNLPRADLCRSREELSASAVALQSDRIAYVDDKQAAHVRGRGS